MNIKTSPLSLGTARLSRVRMNSVRMSRVRMNSVRLVITCLGIALGLTKATSAQNLDFKKWVLPILEKSCFECHQKAHRDERGKLRKPKAGLRLDGKGWILRGSKEEKVVIPGKPEDSSLYYLTVLDHDDGDIMPEDGDPLTKRQTEILRLWIEEGAAFGGWIGAVGPSASEAAVHAPVAVMATPLFDRLAVGKSVLSASAIATAVGQHAQVTAVVPGSALLRLSFRSYEAQVDDGRVAKLRAIAKNLTYLDLSRTSISDRALKSLASMRALTRLDLHSTAVSDRGLLALKSLPELRYLNLYDTKISDRALVGLAKMKSLKALYLWKTEVTAAGVASLRQSLPACKIVFELDLPVVRSGPATKARDGKRKKRKQI